MKGNIYSRSRFTEVTHMDPSESKRLTKRKKVIDLIRNQSQRHSEILEKTGIPESTVNRILKELKSLGLIRRIKKEVHDYWVWIDHETLWQGSHQTYDIAIGHAKDLLPGFQNLLTYGIFFENATNHYWYDIPEPSIPFKKLSILSKCAENHLKAYPTIYNALTSYRSFSDKYKDAEGTAAGKLVNMLRDFYVINNRWLTWHWERMCPIKDLITEGVPYVLGPLSKDDVKRLTKMQRGINFQKNNFPLITSHAGIKLLRNDLWFIKGPVQGRFDQKEFEELLQTYVSMKEVYEELTSRISVLKLRVQHQPLEGRCELCPNIIIKEEAPQKN